MYTEARNKATQKYAAKAYDRIELKIKKGDKDKLKEFAAENGLSVSALIVQAVNALAKSQSKKEPLEPLATNEYMK